MEDKIKLLISQLGENRFQREVLLSSYMRGVKGMASAFYIATTTRELVRVIELCQELKLDFLVFGSGSKTFLSTSRFQGLVIKNRSDNLKIFGVKGKISREGLGIEEALLEADSGVSLKRLAEFAKEQGLVGLDFWERALGTVGGSLGLDLNLRAKTAEVKVFTIDGEVKSKLAKDVVRGEIILSVVFKLKSGIMPKKLK